MVIAGGVEHMGHHPMGEGVDPNPRIVAEKLVDPSALVMGSTAENLHDRFPELTKERADAFAAASQAKLAQAYADGKIQPDLVPVRHPERGRRLGPGRRRRAAAARHNGRGPQRPQDAVPPARPGHGGQQRRAERRRDGLPPGRRPRPLPSSGLPVRMRLVGYAFAGVEPEVMGVGPVPATERALSRGRADASRTSACSRSTRPSPSRCSPSSTTSASPTTTPGSTPYGGAIAVGHPLASSGVRLMTQLARQFEEHPEVRYGLTAMCIGIGMGGAVIWENPHHAEYGVEVAA